MISPIWRRSIRLRLLLWYSIFVVILLALLVGSTVLGQQLSSRDYFEGRLEAAARAAVPLLTLDADGTPALTGEIDEDDVHVTVLSEGGELLLGKRSFAFSPKEENLRVLRRVKGGLWYLLDFPVTVRGTPLWLRCYMSSVTATQMMRTLLLALLVGVPMLLLLTLVGGNLIAKRALKPLIEMTATAESISGSGDLDRRIQLEGQTDEVARLANAFNRMLERLQRSMEREKRFISDASHELRTPISVISAQSEYALAPERSVEEKDAALAVIRERAERAGRMLNQMLLLTRMDAHRLPLHRERLNLSELAEGLCEELREEAVAKDMELRGSIASGVEVEGDELLLTRMLTNLIQNAIQYGRPGGHIELTLCAREERALLSVRDDGPGIPESEQSRIWERFYQVEKCADERSGSGLGLPIVRWIAEAHGGTISLRSKPGEGSAFTVELPKVES